MKHAITVAVAAGLLVGWASVSRAQSLGDVAKKEEARRKRTAKAGKVYTNESLRGSGETPPPASGTSPEAAAATQPGAPESGAPEAAPEQAPAQDARRDQAYWRGRISKAREGLDRSRTFQEALQSRINALTADFTSRDDPAQRQVVGNNRQKALAELARVNGEIAGFEKQIRDIEEEARRAGVPPGWLR